LSEEKKPDIKTLQDKGAKIDYVKLSDGRELFVFEEERFRGLQLYGFRLGWSNKYQVVAPSQLTRGTISIMSGLVTKASGAQTSPEDISVLIAERKDKESDRG